MRAGSSNQSCERNRFFGLSILTLVCWIYLLDSVTEKLRLADKCIEYRSIFSRRRKYHLNELEAVLLVHEGFNLEKGFESIEFRRFGRNPDRLRPWA